jgi:hypothetical protein
MMRKWFDRNDRESKEWKISMAVLLLRHVGGGVVAVGVFSAVNAKMHVSE